MQKILMNGAYMLVYGIKQGSIDFQICIFHYYNNYLGLEYSIFFRFYTDDGSRSNSIIILVI